MNDVNENVSSVSDFGSRGKWIADPDLPMKRLLIFYMGNGGGRAKKIRIGKEG